jgi:hypothetical protein
MAGSEFMKLHDIHVFVENAVPPRCARHTLQMKKAIGEIHIGLKIIHYNLLY